MGKGRGVAVGKDRGVREEREEGKERTRKRAGTTGDSARRKKHQNAASGITRDPCAFPLKIIVSVLASHSCLPTFQRPIYLLRFSGHVSAATSEAGEGANKEGEGGNDRG